MIRRHARALVALLLLGSAGATGHGMRIMQRQNREIVAMQREADALAQEVALLQRERAALTRELGLAEQQLAALPESSPRDSAALLERAPSEVGRWVAQAKSLQNLFQAQPSEAIPELTFLREADWLLLARRLDLGSERKRRIATAEIRNEAKRKFGELLLGAVNMHVATWQKRPPADALALLSYFDVPIERALLERYEIIMRAGPVDLETGVQLPEPWRIWEKQPLDPVHDLRLTVVSNGSFAVARSW